MSLGRTIQTLKAAADPTRLRLLALLANGEATVGELQEILEQSQPRVSRHLRVLGDAGLVERFRDGHWIYYRLTTAPVRIIDEVLALIGGQDERIRLDRIALDRVKRNREREFYGRRLPGDAGFGPRPTDEQLAEALDDGLRPADPVAGFGDVLDVGCGSGTLLRLLARRTRHAVGLDRSRRMRLLARSRLHRAGLANCTVRDGDLATLPFASGVFDVVILDEVLTACGDALGGLREAQRVLKQDGQLLIVDRIQPVASKLPAHGKDSQVFENQLKAMLAELGMRVEHRHWFPGKAMEWALIAAVQDRLQHRTGTYD